MVAIVTLASGAARVDVVPSLGGAVAAFQWQGHEVMRHTPAQVLADGNVRLCASFPLVPFSNRIEDGQLRFEGCHLRAASQLSRPPARDPRRGVPATLAGRSRSTRIA